MVHHQRTKEKKYIEVRNPKDGKIIETLTIFSREQVEEKISLAEKTYFNWTNWNQSQRIKSISKFLKYFVKHQDEIIEVMILESGKTKMDALLEFFAVCESIKYVCKNAEKALRTEKRHSGIFFTKKASVNYLSYGVIAIISPWNYPLILSLVPIINAIVSGNTVVIKPSELTPFTTLKAIELMERSGIPKGVVNAVIGDSETGSILVESPSTKLVSFTGSTNVGRKIAEICGRLLKPCLLELGGNDPMIIFQDADIERAAKAAIWGGFFNSGQSCISVERVYVHEKAKDAFLKALKNELNQMPKESNGLYRDIGCLISNNQLTKINEHVSDAIKKGGEVFHGGKTIHAGSKYFEPTVMTNVSHEMLIMREETFGTEISVITFDTDQEAISLANDSEYGLNASIWTNDVSKARKFAKLIHAGGVCINDCLTNYLIADLPFGGVKESGLGRIHGVEGIRAYTYSQAIVESNNFLRIPEIWWYPYSLKKMNLFRKLIRVLYG